MEVLNGLANAVEAATPGLIGGIWGTIIAQNDIVAREVARGEDPLMNALVHIGQANIAQAFTATVWEHSYGVSLLSSLVTTFVTAGMHGYIYNSPADPNDNIRQWCLFITDNITNAARCTHILNVIALFYFGNILMGTAVCGMFVFCLLDKAGHLPPIVQKVYYSVLMNQWFITIAQVVTSSGLSQLWALLTLVTRVVYTVEKWWYASEKKERAMLDLREPCQLTLDQFTRILNGGAIELEVDRNSIYKIMPGYNEPTPGINHKQTLLRLFDTLGATESFRGVVRGKLQHDEVSRRDDMAHPGEDPLVRAKRYLETFLNRLEARQVAAGVAIDYDEFDRHLKIIAEYISGPVDLLTTHQREVALLRANPNTNEIGEDLKRDLQKALKSLPFVGDCLIKLAIEGGQYCQAGVAPAISRTYRDVIIHKYLASDIPEHQKAKLIFYQHLAGVRDTVFQGFIEIIFQQYPRLLRQYMSNRHNYNMLVEMYGEHFGLVSTGSENDILAQLALSSPENYIFYKMLNWGGVAFRGRSATPAGIAQEFIFEEAYTEDRVVTELIESGSLEGRPPHTNIVPWFTAWINSQPDIYATEEEMLLKHFDEDDQFPTRNLGESDAAYATRIQGLLRSLILENKEGEFPPKNVDEDDDVYVARVRGILRKQLFPGVVKMEKAFLNRIDENAELPRRRDDETDTEYANRLWDLLGDIILDQSEDEDKRVSEREEDEEDDAYIERVRGILREQMFPAICGLERDENEGDDAYLRRIGKKVILDQLSNAPVKVRDLTNPPVGMDRSIEVNVINLKGQEIIFDVQIPNLLVCHPADKAAILANANRPQIRRDESEDEYVERYLVWEAEERALWKDQDILSSANGGGKFPPKNSDESDDEYITRIRQPADRQDILSCANQPQRRENEEENAYVTRYREWEAEERTRRQDADILRSAKPGGKFPPKSSPQETDPAYISRIREFINEVSRVRKEQHRKFFQAMAVDMKILRERAPVPGEAPRRRPALRGAAPRGEPVGLRAAAPRENYAHLFTIGVNMQPDNVLAPDVKQRAIAGFNRPCNEWKLNFAASYFPRRDVGEGDDAYVRRALDSSTDARNILQNERQLLQYFG